MSRPTSAQINLAHLRHNYHVLRKRAAPARIMAVVKAEAYGHGLDIVAPALHAEHCLDFAVTDAAEGARLREILPDDKVSIVLLSGVFDSEDATAAADLGLNPVISDDWQLELLREARFSGQAWLKVETGMHRLGTHDAVALYGKMRKAGIGIAGIMSHLACADTPDHPLNAAQLEAFARIHTQLGNNLPASLLNSAGIAAMAEHHGDVVRPGIALYGVEPVPSMRLGLRPVMRLCSRIMAMHELTPGDSVSYGATYTAAKAERIAVVAAGYGDGLPRSLSNTGCAVWQRQRLAIIGRVCMDYCMVDMENNMPDIGDAIEFWGENLLAGKVAKQAGTIAYELFTGVGMRVPRQAVESFA